MCVDPDRRTDEPTPSNKAAEGCDTHGQYEGEKLCQERQAEGPGGAMNCVPATHIGPRAHSDERHAIGTLNHGSRSTVRRTREVLIVRCNVSCVYKEVILARCGARAR